MTAHTKPSRQIFVACGIAAPPLYALADGLAGLRWDGYSFRDQTISELGAIGAPQRLLFSVLLFIVYALMVAFGIGVWTAFEGNRRLRTVGGLIVGVGVLALSGAGGGDGAARNRTRARGHAAPG